MGIGSVLGLWLVAALAITGGRGLLRILPMRWISRLAALERSRLQIADSLG